MAKKKVKNKSWFGRHKILTVLLGIFIFFILIAMIPSDDEATTVDDDEEDYTVEEPETQKEPKKKSYEDMTFEELFAIAIDNLTYDELFRNNEEYVGKLVLYKGEVVQVLGSSGDWAFRIAVTEEGEYYTYYTDVVYVDYDRTERFLERDIVEFIGEIKGLTSYKSIMGAPVEIPRIEAYYMEVFIKAGDRD